MVSKRIKSKRVISIEELWVGTIGVVFKMEVIWRQG